MALTYTVAGLKSELDALETARKARNWDTAWDEYCDYVSVYVTLATANAEGFSHAFPKPDALKEGLMAAREAADEAANAGKRTMTARTSFGSPSARGGRAQYG